MSVATPRASSSSSSTGAQTPTVAALIPVPSHDIVTMHQHSFVSICHKYLDDNSWSPEQLRILQDIFSKFAHNVFANVRKNITVTSAASAAESSELTEPLDRTLAARVAELDNELDQVTARVAHLREEVPRLLDEALKSQVAVDEADSQSGKAQEDGAVAAVNTLALEAPRACGGIGNVISHVANEMNTVAIEFKDVKKDLDSAVTDCTSTLQVVRRTLNKPQSATEQAIFAATDISNSHKRKVGGKSASPKKRIMVSKEN